MPAKNSPQDLIQKKVGTRARKQAATSSLSALPKNSQSSSALSLQPLQEEGRKTGESNLNTIETPLHELSNNALVLRCQNPTYRDKSAFEELVNRYQ
ncbi:MAG: hypothetical protein AAF528_09185, partial [Cyanobacteria bacterium P01_C01_bin.121]